MHRKKVVISRREIGNLKGIKDASSLRDNQRIEERERKSR